MPDGTMTEQISMRADPLGAPDIHLVFAATDEAVRHALKSVRETLLSLKVDELTLGTIEIVLAEAANNIVEHAYPASALGTVTLLSRIENKLVRFELRDTGTALPGGELPPKQNHNLSADLEDLPEGGFGWGLIRDMSTKLTYRRSNGRNILRFSITSEV